MPTDYTKPIDTRCHRCKQVTRWIVGRGGKFSRCSVCGDRYPCAHACGHLDCRAERSHSTTETR